MHNFYLCDPAFERPLTLRQRIAARLLNKLRVRANLQPDFDPATQMITPEQRINLWHLAEQVLAYDIAGDFVDIGCFDGRTSALLAQLLAGEAPDKKLHLYDSFEHRLGLATDTKTALLAHFAAHGLAAPLIHGGRFEDTLPPALPERIAFAQIDCGVGAPPAEHAALIRHCLDHVWPRLSPGAICLVQDYHDPAAGSSSPDYYPFLKEVVDEFLTPHGVKAWALFSGKCSHGFFRKPLPTGADQAASASPHR